MAAINTSQELGKVRSKINAMQQVISKLELELQTVILGGSGTAKATLVSNIRDTIGRTGENDLLGKAFEDGVQSFSETDQTMLRQMLYQARAQLGELRVEEQQWNQEVNEEKARRKDLGDFAKG
jgi:ABC-type transporter Mla maintaining outer membrane lipid asymmetry ATPase subunit MlaF